MEIDTLLWTTGAVALLILLHRAVLGIFALRRFTKNYTDELNNILNDDECKVKGRFD